MKKIMLLLLPIVLLMHCTPNDKGVKSMQGAYRMLAQTINDGKKDTTYQSSQLKIFTDSHMMYANINSDSATSFGIGEYTMDKGSISEKVFFSASDSMSNNQPSSFQLEIEKTPNGYKQIIRDMKMQNGTISLTEEYETTGTDKKSPLDGAWKGVKVFYINNGDTTTAPEFLQYKVYGSGNFIFGHSIADSTGRKRTGMGYGTFETVDDKNIKETVKVSTYKIAGQTFNISIEMADADHYRQTITNNGAFQIEEYERIIKK